MKHFNKSFYYFISLLCFIISSCKKDIPQNGSVSSITLVNSVVGSSPVIADFYGSKYVSTFYSTTNQISYGGFYEYSLASGNAPVVVYQKADTTHTMYKQNITLGDQGIYSLFLCGTTTTPDAVLTTDNLPYHALADSTVGIRFINLSQGSNPISVNIQGKANGSEVQTLAYKAVTNFTNYPATYKISSYIFEFRDASSGMLLTTFTVSGVNNGSGTNTSNNQYRWKNITIALKGLPGGSGATAQSAFQINNY